MKERAEKRYRGQLGGKTRGDTLGTQGGLYPLSREKKKCPHPPKWGGGESL